MTLMSVRRGARTVAVAAAALAVMIVVAPPPAGAAAPTPASSHTIKLIEVNSTDPNNVEVSYTYDGSPSDVANLKVTENGKPVQTQDAKAQREHGVVFVVDTSASTDTNGVLAEARNAVKAMTATLTPKTLMAVVAAGNDAQLVAPFTPDATAVDTAMHSLTPAGDGALWEAVARAANSIKDRTGMLGSIVLITDGNNGKGAAFSNARGLASEAGAPVYVVGIDGGKLGSDPKDLADATGGVFATSTKATDETQLLGGFTAQINGSYAFTYKSAITKGVNDLGLVIGDTSTKSSYIIGSVTRRPSARVPTAGHVQRGQGLAERFREVPRHRARHARGSARRLRHRRHRGEGSVRPGVGLAALLRGLRRPHEWR